MQLVKVSYEQCRLEFFEEQLAAAKRKLDYAVKRNYPFDVCASRGEVVAFYEWAVEMALKEVAADNNVGSKWIPVTERLPENMDDRVLVLLPTTSYHYPIGNQHIDTDRYRGEYRKWVRYGDKVTHWMPLPEAPKEVE